MKLKDVEVGGRYHAKVSGTLAVVRVVEEKQIPPAYHQPNRQWWTVISAINEATGRRITVRSPQHLRPLPAKGCEFCRQPFNRTDGEFVCPYCGDGWPGV
jgi:hypothetical protein